MKKEKLMFPCGDISLEGVLWLPDDNGPFPAVVVCHPHPLYGGNMNNNIVHEVCAALGEHSIASLRFNFRGVGRSEGSYADGIGEQNDVKAALSFLEGREEIDSSKLALCGYSFGTMVSIPVADVDERIKAYAGVSSFFVAPDLLRNFHKPKFFIHGTNDDFISPRQAVEIINKLPDPKTFELVEGADHFWWGFDRGVGEKVGSFFASCFK
ncbi:MAG: dienelactone hydrolase family protein [Chloroflexi bacterium]|nr:dienelactone hydrolase family protein [Chloroflexota bacterium]